MLISLMEVSGKPSVSRSILIFFSAKIFLLSLSLALHIPPAGQVMLMLAQHSISRCHTDCDISDNLLIAGNSGSFNAVVLAIPHNWLISFTWC